MTCTHTTSTGVPRPRVRYLARIEHAKELSLTGSADADFWRRHLKNDGLEPVCHADGSAQMLVLAAEMKWKCQLFREATVSVAVRISGETDTGFYLLHAFNTNRWFAWCERTFFSTPFTREECRLTVAAPLGFSVGPASAPILHTAMSSAARPPARPFEHHWEGRAYLPRRSGAGPRKFFHALTTGRGHTWDFLPSDTFQIDSRHAPPALGLLTESGFTPQQWILRPDATHGKSRTCSRT